MQQSYVNSFVAQVFSSETYSKHSYSHMTLLFNYQNQQSYSVMMDFETLWDLETLIGKLLHCLSDSLANFFTSSSTYIPSFVKNLWALDVWKVRGNFDKVLF